MKDFIKNTLVVTALCCMAFGVALPLKIALAAGSSLDCNPSEKGCDYQPLTTIPGLFTQKIPTNPLKVITNIYGLSIGIAGVLAVAMITWAGFQYATTEAITGKSDAKEHWEGALWGLAILLGSYILLRTINADLVNIDLSLPDPIKGGLLSSKSGGQELLDAAKNEANAAIAQTQTARQRLEDAQKSLNALAGTQAERDLLAQQLADLDPNAANTATQRAELVAKIAAADKILDAAKKEISDAQTAVDSTVVRASIAKTTSDVMSAIAAGDIAGAKSIQKSSSDIAQRTIDKLISDGAPAPAIAEARINKIAGDADLTQKILVAEQFDVIERSYNAGYARGVASDAGYDISTDTATQQAIIRARTAIASNFSESQVAIRAIDPAKTDLVKDISSSNQSSLDARVAAILGCKNGIAVSTQTVRCNP